MKDKIAVVTGASQGIGEAVARRFAAAGMRLVLSDLTDEVIPKAQEIAKQFPDAGIIAVVTDVSDPKACDELMAAAVLPLTAVDNSDFSPSGLTDHSSLLMIKKLSLPPIFSCEDRWYCPSRWWIIPVLATWDIRSTTSNSGAVWKTLPE